MAKKRKRKLGWFGKTALFLILLAVPLTIGGLGVLWEFLDDYQKSLPENAAEEALKLFEEGDLEALSQYIDYSPNELDASDSFDAIVEAYFSPKDGGKGEYTLITQMGGAAEKRYVVALDNVKVGEIILKDTRKVSDHGFPLWELSDIELFSVTGEYGAEILAPADVQVLINGNLLSADYMTDNAVVMDVEGYRDLPQGYSQPLQVRYEVSGLLEAPKVEIRTTDGSECVLEMTEDSGLTQSYRVTRYASEEFAAGAGVKAEMVSKAYAEFITKDAELTELSSYLLPGGSLQKYLQDFSNYWYIDHDSNEFKNLKLENFVLYDASHYSCDVSFDYYIYMGTKAYEYPTAYTLYFVREGEQWLLATLEIR